MQTNTRVWATGLLLFIPVCMSCYGMLWNRAQDQAKWSSELLPAEEILHQRVISSLAKADIGMKFIADLSKDPAIHELMIRQTSAKFTPTNYQGFTYTFKQAGRFSVGREGKVEGYDYSLTLTRPPVSVLGLQEETFGIVSELMFTLSSFIFIGFLMMSERFAGEWEAKKLRSRTLEMNHRRNAA